MTTPLQSPKTTIAKKHPEFETRDRGGGIHASSREHSGVSARRPTPEWIPIAIGTPMRAGARVFSSARRLPVKTSFTMGRGDFRIRRLAIRRGRSPWRRKSYSTQRVRRKGKKKKKQKIKQRSNERIKHMPSTPPPPPPRPHPHPPPRTSPGLLEALGTEGEEQGRIYKIGEGMQRKKKWESRGINGNKHRRAIKTVK